MSGDLAGKREAAMKHIELALADESLPRAWFWCSFVDTDEDRFLGVAVVEAPLLIPTSAPAAAALLGINPGGEVRIDGPLDPPPPAEWRNRLLTREEAEHVNDLAGGEEAT